MVCESCVLRTTTVITTNTITKITITIHHHQYHHHHLHLQEFLASEKNWHCIRAGCLMTSKLPGTGLKLVPNSAPNEDVREADIK